MSNSWDLRCRDCGEDAGFDYNHDGEFLARLWAEADLWASLVDSDGWARMSETTHSEFFCFPEFAKKHLGHDVVPWSEYGYALDQCAKRYECSSCGQSLVCQKDPGHPGSCGPKLFDAPKKLLPPKPGFYWVSDPAAFGNRFRLFAHSGGEFGHAYEDGPWAGRWAVNDPERPHLTKAQGREPSVEAAVKRMLSFLEEP